MATHFPLLSLPTEIRLRIYTFYFSSLILRPCYNPFCSNLKGNRIGHTVSPNSLFLVNNRIRRESAQLLFPHALFWVENFNSLLCLLRHYSPAQLQSIRHFAISTSLVPLQQPDPLPEPAGWPDFSSETRLQTDTLRTELCRGFYEQICAGLRTLVLFNPTDAAARRRVMEQQAGRELGEEEFEVKCLENMGLKAQFFVPVLIKNGLGGKVAEDEKGGGALSFRLLLRFLGSDGKVRTSRCFGFCRRWLTVGNSTVWDCIRLGRCIKKLLFVWALMNLDSDASTLSVHLPLLEQGQSLRW
jgi:hypothetical protein